MFQRKQRAYSNIDKRTSCHGCLMSKSVKKKKKKNSRFAIIRASIFFFARYEELRLKRFYKIFYYASNMPVKLNVLYQRARNLRD